MEEQLPDGTGRIEREQSFSLHYRLRKEKVKLFKEKILIIEDDVQIQNFMVYTLENAGFSVEGVVNGKDGISYMVRKNADLILLDLGLPDMDGMEALHKKIGRAHV